MNLRQAVDMRLLLPNRWRVRVCLSSMMKVLAKEPKSVEDRWIVIDTCLGCRRGEDWNGSTGVGLLRRVAVYTLSKMLIRLG